jgi:metal-responsive CopG/Arc/MetJ family transcriptional regulator
MSYTLINFNIPNHLKNNFDQLVNFKRVSRTSVLNSMIEEFCRREFKLIKEDGKLNDLITNIKIKNLPKINHQKTSSWEDSYDEPLNIPVSDDFLDAYDDGFKI